MHKLTEVIKIFFAYLMRPQLYPELFRKIYKNLFQRSSAERGKEKAEKWCESMAVSQEEAMRKITGKEDFVHLDKAYAEVLQKAKVIEKETPVKMGGAGALDLIYNLCEFTAAKNALETGVAYGWSSLATLLSLSKRNGILYSSDMPYMIKNNDEYVGCVVPENLKENWKLFRYADRESLPKIFKEQDTFDFVHYDSDKTYNGRMWAYNLLWEKIRPGGIFISDDIGDNAAFMDFCTSNGHLPIIVGFDGKYAGVILK